MALDPLVTEADVTSRLGRALSAVEAARLPSLCRDASAVIRGKRVTGQDFTRATTTERVRIQTDHVILRQRPVNDVTAVTLPDTGLPVSRYRWNRLTTVYLFLWNPETDFEMPWRPGFDVVDVTYDHGYDELPDDVVGVGASMIMRALGTDPADASTTQERTVSYEYRRAPETLAGVLGILPAEIDVLRPYKAGTGARSVRMT